MAGQNKVKFVGETQLQQKNIPAPSFDSKGGVTVVVEYDLAVVGTQVIENALAQFKIGMPCRYLDVTDRTIEIKGAELRSVTPDNKFPYCTITCIYGGKDPGASGEFTNSYTERTVEKTLSISAQFDPPVAWTAGKMITGVQRTIVYQTQESAFEEYRQSKPRAADGKPPGSSEVKIKSSPATVVNFTDRDGKDQTMDWNGSLPAGVISKITPTGPTLTTSGFNAEKITGTSWWKATGIKSYELVDPNS